MRRGATLLFIALGIALRLVYLCCFRPDVPVNRPAFDSYGALAESIAAGRGFSFGEHQPTAGKPPGYPWFLAGVRKIAGTGERWTLAAQLLLSVATLLAVLAIARGIGEGVTTWAAALWAVHPFLIFLTGSYLSENLFLPLAGIVYLAAARWLRAPSLGAAALLGATVGASAYVRPVLLPFLPVLVLVGGKTAKGKRLASFSVMLLACGLIMAPWLVRNWTVFHRFPVWTTHGGLTFWGGNNRAAVKGQWVSPERFPWALEGKAPGWWSSLSEIERDRAFSSLGRAFIRDHPRQWIAAIPSKVGRLWGPGKGSSDARHAAAYDTAGWIQWMLTVPWFLAALTLGGIIPRPLSRVFWAGTLTVTLTAALLYGDVRLRLPVEPLIIAGAAALLRRVVTREGS